MNIRSETVADYAAIAALNIRAFGERVAEASMVANQRQRRHFDPALSLVAEIDGQIVGHVLFMPERTRLLGEDVAIVNLAPIAVDPARQKQGIGGALIEAGHSLAREKGYALSILLGHTTYYPRFGYRTHAFGSATLGTWSAKAPALLSRPLSEADLPRLHALWQAQESGVDFALDPGTDMADWLSVNPAIRVTVYERNGDVVGYSRVHAMQTAQPAYLLAQDAEIARSIVWLMAGGGAMVSLPIHPASSWAHAFGEASAVAWDAAMACPLRESPFEEYARQVKAGARPPGRPLWATSFDVE